MNGQKSADWYKNAVIYGLDIETFFDADGDGKGDFKGAAAKLPYLSWLGINCIWLLPFYPTSHRDNGYDVINYMNVDQQLGTLEDFRTFIQEAKHYDIKIIIDLVLHHTSDEHPWFIAATTDKKSQYYDYYIWTNQVPPKPHDKNIFPTEESDVWHYDEHAKAYYHHKFYHFEPDLNVANERVQREIYKIVEFWLSFDIDGFRIDAATHMFEQKGLPGTEIEDPGKFIEDFRSFIQTKKPDAILLGEADVKPDKIKLYFGENNRFQLLFNFLLDNNLFLALARKSATPLYTRLNQLKDISSQGQWANFVRNLDELDLERLTDKEREDVYQAFAPDPSMRIYNRGIRRRTAPMLNGNISRLKMLYSLLFSFPGTPLFVYGDEIGMGEDLSLKERVAVRTPMQWNEGKNAGFSSVNESELTKPVIDNGEFSYKTINVAEEKEDPTSLLQFFKKLIALRKKYSEIGHAEYSTIDLKNGKALGLLFEGETRNILTLHNLSDGTVSIQKKKVDGNWKEILSDTLYTDTEEIYELHPYGFRWFVSEE